MCYAGRFPRFSLKYLVTASFLRLVNLENATLNDVCCSDMLILSGQFVNLFEARSKPACEATVKTIAFVKI